MPRRQRKARRLSSGAGKPVSRIMPLARAKADRKLGLLNKKARIPDNFNEPLPGEALAEFFGAK